MEYDIIIWFELSKWLQDARYDVSPILELYARTYFKKPVDYDTKMNDKYI